MPDFAGASRCQQGRIGVAGAVHPEQGSPQQAHRPAVLGRGSTECRWERCSAGQPPFRKGEGIWRDDAQGGKLLFDEPVVIQCYTSEHVIEQKMPALRDFLHRMGREARQGAIGLVIDDDYLEIGFPLEEAPTPRNRKARNGGN